MHTDRPARERRKPVVRRLSFERTILAAAFLLFVFILDFVAGFLFGFYESQRLRLTKNLSAIRTLSHFPS
jgi:hypothetical protein